MCAYIIEGGNSSVMECKNIIYFSLKVLEADRNDHDIVNYALETLVNVTGPEEYPEETGETWFLFASPTVCIFLMNIL